LPACLLACLPACLLACLPTFLLAYLPACLPADLPACLPADLPAKLLGILTTQVHRTGVHWDVPGYYAGTPCCHQESKDHSEL